MISLQAGEEIGDCNLCRLYEIQQLQSIPWSQAVLKVCSIQLSRAEGESSSCEGSWPGSFPVFPSFSITFLELG